MVERKRRLARWIVSFMICLFVGEIGTIEVCAATGTYQGAGDNKVNYIISKNTVLSQNGSEPYAGVYCYDGNLTLESGVQLTSSGISQLAIIVKGTLTIKQGAAIRVRNGYYQQAPSTKISNINADTMILYGNEDAKNGIILFPNTYGKGGNGGVGGKGGNGYKAGTNIKAPGNGGNGGGGGYGGGTGGAAGAPGTPYSGGTSGTYGYAGASNGLGSNGGGATGLGSQGANNASSTTNPGGGGGANGGDGGSTSTGGQYIMASGGSGGGGGYGGGVLTIYADSIKIESTAQPVFIAHGQCGGVRGIGGNSGENGQNGEGGMLVIQTNNYQYNTAHWTTDRTSKSSVGQSYTSYGGGHSSLIHTKPQAVFVNGVKISTGSETVPAKWDINKLSDCSIGDIDDQIYTGEAVTPAVVLRDADGKVLELNVDYTVSYTHNTDLGTALVTIKGKGDYTGTCTKTFEIVCKHNPGTLIVDQAPTCTENGKGHISCTICGEVLDSNKIIKSGHTWDAGRVTKEATETTQGVKTYRCKVCGKTRTEVIPKKASAESNKENVKPEKNEEVKDDKGTAMYEIADVSRKEVAYKAPANRNATKITVPSAVTINGTEYKVTAIADKTFSGCKKLTKVNIGKNIKTIGASAFSGCGKLKTVSMGANVTTIGDKAFYKCKVLTKITIPAKVSKIGKQAFYGCKKLKTITIRTSKLTSKKVGNKAFKGIHAKATVKVPKKKLTSYKRILKAKGVGSKVKIKK